MADGKLNITIKEANLDLNTLLLWRIYQLLERNMPMREDRPFFYPKTITIRAGKTKNIIVMTGRREIWFLSEVAWTYYDDSEYSLSKDDGALILDKMDFSVQPIKLTPPEVVQNKIQLKIKNNSSTDRNYTLYFLGWKREV